MLNLTQHKATPEQVNAGVLDLNPDWRERLVKLLTFDDLPTATEIAERAAEIAELASDYFAIVDTISPLEVMIGGAPYLMSALERELTEKGIKPFYAFSKRESVEEVQADGSVRKVNVFRHVGFVEA